MPKRGVLPADGTWTEETVPKGWMLADEPCEHCGGTGSQRRVVPRNIKEVPK